MTDVATADLVFGSITVAVFDASGRQSGHWIYGDDGSFSAA